MINTSKEIAYDVEMSNLNDEDFRNKVWVDRDELVKKIKIICLQNGEEITQSHLLLELGVDED